MTPAELLQQSLQAWNLQLEASIQARLLEYLDFLLLANQKLNLTAVEYPSAVTKHLVDSLAALKVEGLREIPGPWFDLGSGGGLPGLPLALALPDKQITLIEATQKKARFLEDCVEKFGLRGRVKVVSQRAEDFGQGQGREQANLLTCRAVAKLPVLLELALPLLKLGGKLLAYKGPGLSEEVDKSCQALDLLKGKIWRSLDFTLPFTGESRTLLLVEKVGTSPKQYPRLPGVPAKSPL